MRKILKNEEQQMETTPLDEVIKMEGSLAAEQDDKDAVEQLDGPPEIHGLEEISSEDSKEEVEDEGEESDEMYEADIEDNSPKGNLAHLKRRNRCRTQNSQCSDVESTLASFLKQSTENLVNSPDGTMLESELSI